MLELEVVPERSLGSEVWEFVLGMSFAQAVQIIQQQARLIRGVETIYSELNPLGMDLVINLSQDGIKLIFDPVQQRLKIIEVYNMSKVKLKYCAVVFNSPEVPPTIEQIDHSFGATHPGVFDPTLQLFILNFRGVSFSFPVDPSEGHIHHRHTGTTGITTLPVNCRESSPVVSKMSIYAGNSYIDTKAPLLPVSCFHNYCYLDHLLVLREANRTVGIKLFMLTEAPAPMEMKRHNVTASIYFGDTCQDVSTLIGSPSKIFYKSDDKMKIHSPNAHKLLNQRTSDYFYNYFTLGLDVLFDGKTHAVKKFILHTNYPGHYNFNMYYRCDFRLVLSSEQTTIKPYDGSGGKSIDSSGGGGDRKIDEPGVVTAYTKWETLKDLLVKPSTRPVVLNRASSTNTTNPFGSTFCYGYQDLIFEVMLNSHIASLTLYQVPDSKTPEPNK